QTLDTLIVSLDGESFPHPPASVAVTDVLATASLPRLRSLRVSDLSSEGLPRLLRGPVAAGLTKLRLEALRDETLAAFAALPHLPQLRSITLDVGQDSATPMLPGVWASPLLRDIRALSCEDFPPDAGAGL